jgi:general secretion pathway protein A
VSLARLRESSFDRGARNAALAVSAPADGPAAYEAFYVLAENPFSQTSAPRFFYASPSHAHALEELRSAIRRRESLSVLAGEMGTGKTTLCRTILQQLPRKTVSAFVHDPAVSREDLLTILLVDFGVATVDEIARGRFQGATRTELSYLLRDFLGSLAPHQAFAVVFVEEAQSLSAPALEELRILADSDGQLQLVLIGQPQLRARLTMPEMRQLEQRISVSCSLSPLDRDGVAGYIAHRLRVAGASPDRPRFTADAVAAVHRFSNGVPRLVNRLCDRILREASLVEATTIDGALAESSLADETGVPAIGRPAADPIALWLSQVDEVDLATLALEEARKKSPFGSEVPGLRLGLGVDVDRPVPGARWPRYKLSSSPRRIVRAAERIVAAPFAVPSYLYRTITDLTRRRAPLNRRAEQGGVNSRHRSR